MLLLRSTSLTFSGAGAAVLRHHRGVDRRRSPAVPADVARWSLRPKCRSGSGSETEFSVAGERYRRMLECDPYNSLLLMNYATFLHQEKDYLKDAAECYERAILESPNDGKVLALYANLVWEMQRDKERADSYYQRAI